MARCFARERSQSPFASWSQKRLAPAPLALVEPFARKVSSYLYQANTYLEKIVVGLQRYTPLWYQIFSLQIHVPKNSPNVGTSWTKKKLTTKIVTTAKLINGKRIFTVTNRRKNFPAPPNLVAPGVFTLPPGPCPSYKQQLSIIIRTTLR